MTLPFEPPKFREAVESDYYRASAKAFSWWQIIFEALRNKTFAPVFTMRCCQSSVMIKSPIGKTGFLLSRILHRWACTRIGVEMPWSVNIGNGFLIVHGWGAVINGGAVIGRNVTLCHGVTIGGRDTVIDGRRIIILPQIDDGVYLGPHACVLGCRIGTGSFLAPHALVVHSVIENSLLTSPQADLRSTNFQHFPINSIHELKGGALLNAASP
jgi:serine O-acetyltransferase